MLSCSSFTGEYCFVFNLVSHLPPPGLSAYRSLRLDTCLSRCIKTVNSLLFPSLLILGINGVEVYRGIVPFGVIFALSVLNSLSHNHTNQHCFMLTSTLIFGTLRHWDKNQMTLCCMWLQSRFHLVMLSLYKNTRQSLWWKLRKVVS